MACILGLVRAPHGSRPAVSVLAAYEKDQTPQATISGLGVIISAGSVCPLAALDDGRVYALFDEAGLAQRMEPGTRVKLAGTPVHKSDCQQDQTLKLLEIKALISPGDPSTWDGQP